MAPQVLVIVDIQNDFCPGGALAVEHGDEIIPLANAMMARFDHVVATQDWHPQGHMSFASSHAGLAPFEEIEAAYGAQTLWPDHCIQGTAGAEFHQDLDTARAELIIRKGFRRDIDSYSAFFENDRKTPTGLAGYLSERGLTGIVLAGLATDFCVGFSALDARKLGLEVTVAEDACRAIDLDGSLDAARREFSAAGVKLASAADF